MVMTVTVYGTIQKCPCQWTWLSLGGRPWRHDRGASLPSHPWPPREGTAMAGWGYAQPQRQVPTRHHTSVLLVLSTQAVLKAFEPEGKNGTSGGKIGEAALAAGIASLVATSGPVG